MNGTLNGDSEEILLELNDESEKLFRASVDKSAAFLSGISVKMSKKLINDIENMTGERTKREIGKKT